MIVVSEWQVEWLMYKLQGYANSCELLYGGIHTYPGNEHITLILWLLSKSVFEVTKSTQILIKTVP